MKIKATTPCFRFVNAKPEEQIEKLKEELAEVQEALAAYQENPDDSKAFIHLLVEILDVQACAETFIYQLIKHYSKGEFPAVLLLGEASDKVIAKNMYRGYYQTPDEAEDIAEKLNTNAAEVF